MKSNFNGRNTIHISEKLHLPFVRSPFSTAMISRLRWALFVSIWNSFHKLERTPNNSREDCQWISAFWTILYCHSQNTMAREGREFRRILLRNITFCISFLWRSEISLLTASSSPSAKSGWKSIQEGHTLIKIQPKKMKREALVEIIRFRNYQIKLNRLIKIAERSWEILTKQLVPKTFVIISLLSLISIFPSTGVRYFFSIKNVF